MSDRTLEAGARIEVVFTEDDRRVEVRLPDGASDSARERLGDELVQVLGIDDTDEAEEALRAGMAGVGVVRRLA